VPSRLLRGQHDLSDFDRACHRHTHVPGFCVGTELAGIAHAFVAASASNSRILWPVVRFALAISSGVSFAHNRTYMPLTPAPSEPADLLRLLRLVQYGLTGKCSQQLSWRFPMKRLLEPMDFEGLYARDLNLPGLMTSSLLVNLKVKEAPTSPAIRAVCLPAFHRNAHASIGFKRRFSSLAIDRSRFHPNSYITYQGDLSVRIHW